MHTIFKKAQTSWIWFGVAILFISMAGPSQGGGLDEGFGYDLPLSTDEIDNYEIFTSLVPLGEHSLKRLEENGFVVMADPFSPDQDEITALYRILKNHQLPIFVTSDSLLHIYHIQFDETLREIEEERFYDDLWTLTEEMLVRAEADSEASSGLAKEAAGRNVAFFSVALSLLAPRGDQLCSGGTRDCDAGRFEGAYPYFTPEELEAKSFEVPPTVRDEVEAELALIFGEAGSARSPIFSYEEDYSQYRPRGHYTRSERLKNYFMAMTWYGRMGFLLKGCEGECIVSEEEARIQTLAAAMIANNLLEDPELKDKWDRIYNVTSFYVGYADDLGPYEYSDAIDSLFDGEVQARDLSYPDLDLLKARLAAKRPPRIYGGTGVDSPACAAEPPFSPEEADLCLAATAGLRFMGQRFVPDSYIFQRLVIPNVDVYSGEGDAFTLGPYGRHFPRGLDVMAILGSTRSDEILAALKDSSYQNYSTQRAELQREFDSFGEEEWQKNLYWSWLYALKPLLEAPDSNSPAFTLTTAWQDKELTTALASWAELRHDTILYAKQSYTLKAISLPPEEVEAKAGYVEPVPELYRRLRDLARMNRQGLEEEGLLDEPSRGRLLSLETALERLEEISEAELAGRELTDDDLLFIRDIGERLDEALLGVDERSKKTTIVADVHTDPNTDMALEEAVGYVRMIVVACDRPDGGVFLAAGPAYSYYEFKQPLSERLTDEGWREILVDDPPQDPEWTASFADFLPCSVLRTAEGRIEAAADEEDDLEGEDGPDVDGEEVDGENAEAEGGGDEEGPEGDIEAGTARGAEIRLEEFEVRIGWNLLEGWYADCTIALRNSGDAEGTADVVLEDGEGKLLAELKIPVPPNSTVTERAKVDISGRGQEVNSKLVA